MKKLILTILLSAIFFGCNSIDTDLIINDSGELEKIFTEAYSQEITLVRSTDDSQLASRIRGFGFDKMVIHRNRTDNNISADSLVFFIKLGPYTVLPEKRIVYDFAKTARKFGNEKRQGYESYERIQVGVLDIAEDEMADHVKDCQAVASCLGHNLTWKGIYGKPRKLVTDAIRLLCYAIKKNSPEEPIKFVLMNTAGNRNRDLNEPISFGERLVIGLLRLLLPPHPDNEKAADYLRVNVGQKDPSIEWVVVRPDTLINQDTVTEYELYVSPTRSALFNPGKTSRINVGHFMAKLIVENDLWDQWKGQMPVIYNKVD